MNWTNNNFITPTRGYVAIEVEDIRLVSGENFIWSLVQALMEIEPV
jgi:hypothetical protein